MADIRIFDARIFVALEMSGAVRQQVSDVARHFGHLDQMRWVRPEGAHLTLKFLGDINADLVSDVVSVIQNSARNHKPLTLATGDVGAFPRLERARVLWLGVDGEVDGLKTLQSHICQELERIGFEPERRQFMGHITVGRARKKPVKVAKNRLGNWHSVHFSVDCVSVMKSDLRPGGAVYTGMGYGLLSG